MRTSSEESDVEYELCRRVSNKQPTPHSIADILGWSRDCPPVLSHQRRQCPASEMADCATDLESVVNDEPLDLSLHKSKCSDDEQVSDSPKLKRRTIVDSHSSYSQQWNSEQSLQMAANFSTVLQYYLAATRLWQSEVIRYNNESRPESSAELASSDDNRPLTESRPENSPAAASTAATATAATASVVTPPPLSKSAKRRKKDLESQAADGTSRPRKTRTTFTGKQLFELERIFEQKKYLSSNERQEVARLLNVTGSQIKIWFQNRRTKWKKQDPTTAAELAQMKSASRVTKSKPGSDRSQQDAAAISASENSDAATNASSPPPSPSQT